MQVSKKRFQVFGQTERGPTISMAILNHGADINGTEISGAGGNFLPLPSR